MTSKLYIILEDLNNHKNANYATVIKERLDKSLDSYIKSLDDSINYLTVKNRDNVKLLRRMSKDR